MSDYIVGVDESGKGDYFGPLVVASAAVSVLERPLLDELYVRDSKKISDNRVRVLAARIKQQVPHEIIVVMPPKYNDLYQDIGNLNRLLAWGHARAIENILGKTGASSVIADQFAKPEVLQRALMEKGRKIELTQKTGGESEMAVATASVLARAEFLRSLEILEKKFAVSLPKGAGPLVDSAGVKFVQAHGEEALRNVAKLHFKNTRKIGEQLGRIV